MTRNRIIQHLINRYALKSYLELGVEYRQTFDSIRCKNKVGIEPYIDAGVLKMTSDEFFAQNKEFFDVIFIDALHHSDQAEKDIRNALRFLLPGGFIVIHDCNPTEEIIQKVPREQLIWTGDVWKAFVRLRKEPDLTMYVVDTDWGCGVIQKGKQKPLELEESSLYYNNFSIHKKEWLNLITIEDFLKKIL